MINHGNLESKVELNNNDMADERGVYWSLSILRSLV